MGSEPKKVPAYIRFILGGLAGVGSTCVCHPLDFLKTRMQLSDSQTKQKTVVQLARHVFVTEGILAFYDGLSASLMRQITYTSIRTGIFTSLLDVFTVDGVPPNVWTKMGIGVFTGVIGTFFGNPFDVALIRMAADGRLPPEERRNYKHVVDALSRMVNEEGFEILFRGLFPTMLRAVVVSVSAFVTYLQAKEFFIRKGLVKDNLWCHFISSMVSGLVTTATSMPFDAMKTRLQNMKTINGVPQYAGMFDAGMKIYTQEGFFAFYKGVTPYYLRQGPNTVLYFIILEGMTKFYKKHILGDTSDTGL